MREVGQCQEYLLHPFEKLKKWYIWASVSLWAQEGNTKQQCQKELYATINSKNQIVECEPSIFCWSLTVLYQYLPATKTCSFRKWQFQYNLHLELCGAFSIGKTGVTRTCKHCRDNSITRNQRQDQLQQMLPELYPLHKIVWNNWRTYT